MLNLCRELVQLRRRRRELSAGSFEPNRPVGATLRYSRRNAGSEISVLLNLSDTAQTVPLARSAAHLLLSTHMDREESRIEAHVQLRPNEGIIVG
jgi:hypothetical protein